ncbi:AMP-binding protein [Povalibacter sp.]|uniref:AMP-binding protein n=1 Tax=Povalibacter sp. TaxID=1962978 RepID=UPI002F409544
MIDGAMQEFALTLEKFLDHAAKWHSRAEVVTGREGGRTDRVSYADLRARSLRISAMLRAFGVGLGDRVATLAWNTQAHLEAWYGIVGMGAVCHTLNPRLTATQTAVMLAHSECNILVVSADLAALAKQIIEQTPSVRRVLIIDGPVETWSGETSRCSVAGLEDSMSEEHPAAAWGGFDERSACGLCFTSGTTGAPKGVTYTHRSSYLHALRLLQADSIGITAVDSVLAVVPMFHANAWGLPFAAPAAGAKLVLPGRHADGANLACLINKESVTVGVGVPTVWLGLVEHLDATGDEVPSLKRILVGGAPMPPALMERIERRLGAIVQTSWGMTEMSPSGTMSSCNDPQRSAAIAGRPAVGVDLLLTDAGGKPLPQQRNVEGHLRVRGVAVIERYFGEDNPATDAQGWFDTGDLARIDDYGQLHITGRAKDLIKSGGEWINPAEIEAIVCRLPQVSLAAVIGLSDPKWGERPVLFVEIRDQQMISDEALLTTLRSQVAPWWVPDAVIRLQQMPLASTGKIDKMRLRSKYGGG